MSVLTLLKKLKLYDGEDVEGFRQKDVKQIKEQTEREGMDGISPRFVINRISTSLIKPDTRCINPASITASATFGHSASPDNVTGWHSISLPRDMKVCVKYFDNFCHCNPLNLSHLQTHFISISCKKRKKNQIVA